MLDAQPPPYATRVTSKKRKQPGTTAGNPIALADEEEEEEIQCIGHVRAPVREIRLPSIHGSTPLRDRKHKLKATLERAQQHIRDVQKLDIKHEKSSTPAALAGPSSKRPKLKHSQPDPIDLTLEDAADVNPDILELPDLDHRAFSWDFNTVIWHCLFSFES